MIQECNFDENCDIQETIPSLDVDLNLAVKAGVVPDSACSPEYNEISSTDAIIGRIRDAFDVVDAQRYLSKYFASAATTNNGSVVKTEDAALN